MGTQFDETTEIRAKSWRESNRNVGVSSSVDEESYAAGRRSAKESLEILAGSLEAIAGSQFVNRGTQRFASAAISHVKLRGDWPLKDTQ
jgi:hypothetical protein